MLQRARIRTALSRQVTCMNNSLISSALLGMVAFAVSSVVMAGGLAQPVCTNHAGVETNLRPTTPSTDFVIIGDPEDGVVRHERSGLEWQRCAYPGEYSEGACTSSGTWFWQAALEQAALQGNGWRLPNLSELASIVEECTGGPAVNEVVFPGIAHSQRFWTSTTDTQFGANYALVIDFSSGYSAPTLKSSERRSILLVREPQ